MHQEYERAQALSRLVIGAAIEGHRLKGSGLIESIYQKCLMRELEIRSIPAKQEVTVPVEDKGFVFDAPLKLDVIADDCLILESKAVSEVRPVHKAQLLSYMKLIDIPLGLLISFHKLRLMDGVYGMILPGAAGFSEETG